MPRSLRIRKPTAAECRELSKMLEEKLETWQSRRANAVLLYSAGMNATGIAQTLGYHANTIRADLQEFHQLGLASITQPRSLGAAVRFSDSQVVEILRVAELSPYELGLPYGRWSAEKLRQYLIKHRIVKAISREHLRRLLKKGDITFAEYDVSLQALIRNDAPFWLESA